ncbi:MAG: hypothetical protein HYR85_04330 [Planctomycetes bacterium]|nr:hypothetical protein [Planctomycetota bacterium]MBI3843817.1 hypothetical protein [Planctomycetota bacterium]
MWRRSIGALVVVASVVVFFPPSSMAQPLARTDVAALRFRSWLESEQGKARVDAASAVLHDRMGAMLESEDVSARIAGLAEEGRVAEAVHVLHQWASEPTIPNASARIHLERCAACREIVQGAAPLPLCASLRIPDTFTREQPIRERVARLSRVAFDGLPLEALDVDGDGVLETIVADIDGDGLLDRVRVDLTGDGIADLDFHFESGEWRVRRATPWEALGPGGALDAIRCSGVLPASIFDETRSLHYFE